MIGKIVTKLRGAKLYFTTSSMPLEMQSKYSLSLAQVQHGPPAATATAAYSQVPPASATHMYLQDFLKYADMDREDLYQESRKRAGDKNSSSLPKKRKTW